MKRFLCAGSTHDAGLRALLRDTPMDGRIRLALTRDPDFFAAEAIGNTRSEVIALVDEMTDEILGCGSRGIRTMYVGGRPVTAGYLGLLRARESVRGNIFLSRAYRYLRELDLADNGGLPFYLTAILSDNHKARHALIGARAGLPHYVPWSELVSFTIPVSGRANGIGNGEITELTTPAQTAVFTDRANVWSAGRLFAPHYDERQVALLSGSGCTGYRVAGDGYDGSMIVADLSRYKQVVVSGYSQGFANMRPIANAMLTMMGKPRLPKLGSRLSLGYVFALALSGDEPLALERLLALARKGEAGRTEWLSIALDKKSELAPHIRPQAFHVTESVLCVVGWDKERLLALPHGIVHQDIGAL